MYKGKCRSQVSLNYIRNIKCNICKHYIKYIMLYLTWMSGYGAPIRVATYYVVRFLGVYIWISSLSVCSFSYYVFIIVGLSVRSVV
jgi:hypothetical protein